jgi:hypothetical protein
VRKTKIFLARFKFNEPENLEGACEMLERIVRDGGVSFPRTGETYPGFDICKLCSFLVFKKPKEGDE